MKDYSALESKLKSLMEELNALKEADEEEIETAEEETVVDTPVEEVSTEEEVVDVAEESPVADEEKALISSIGGNLVRQFMDALGDLNILIESPHDEKFDTVLADIKENTNKIIGSLQAVVGEGDADVDVQEDAREEAEEIINGGEAVAETEEKEETVDVIEPIEGEDVEEVSEEEVEEKEETKEESLETQSSKPKLDEDLQITIGFSDYHPWSGAVDTYDYLVDEIGESAVESVLEEVFPGGCTDTELNDFLWFGPSDMGSEFYDMFGVKDPYAEDDDEDDEEDEEDFDEAVAHKQRHRAVESRKLPVRKAVKENHQRQSVLSNDDIGDDEV